MFVPILPGPGPIAIPLIATARLTSTNCGCPGGRGSRHGASEVAPAAAGGSGRPGGRQPDGQGAL
eukprot:scaffold139543_cov17-Prasinocladus_malaysianus.AAC.2